MRSFKCRGSEQWLWKGIQWKWNGANRATQTRHILCDLWWTLIWNDLNRKRDITCTSKHCQPAKQSIDQTHDQYQSISSQFNRSFVFWQCKQMTSIDLCVCVRGAAAHHFKWAWFLFVHLSIFPIFFLFFFLSLL